MSQNKDENDSINSFSLKSKDFSGKFLNFYELQKYKWAGYRLIKNLIIV